jgi:hypothetical protein
MMSQIQRLLFKDKGFIPFDWRVSMPQNPDDDFVVVFVQWEQDESWETFVLRIELHAA